MEQSKKLIPLIQERAQELIIGETFKYSELCRFLGEPIKKGSNSKNSQYKEWSRYFEFEIIDKKIVITDVYEIPKERGTYYPANSLYIECIEKILMTYLSKQEKNVTYLSSQYLYLTLGMINKNYIEMQRSDQKPKLIEGLRNTYEWSVEEVQDKSITFYINDFYNRCRTKFSSIIDSSLKSLQRRRLIEYSYVYHMYFEEYDEEGFVTNKYSIYSNDDETRDIMSIEREILDIFGYKDESEVWLRRRSKEYFELILEKGKELYPGLKGVYRCIKFIYNKEDITKALTQEETDIKKKELNDKILTFINNQTEKNYLSTADVAYGEGFKYTRKYEQAQYYLSDKLIKIIDE